MTRAVYWWERAGRVCSEMGSGVDAGGARGSRAAAKPLLEDPDTLLEGDDPADAGEVETFGEELTHAV